MKRFLWLLLLGSWSLTACQEEEDGPVFVRLVNGSDVTYDRVSLYAVPEYQDLGTLAPGDTSAYRRSFTETGHPAMVLRIGDDTIQSICVLAYKLPPPPLDPGYYTFEVTLEEVGRFFYATHQLP